MFLHNLIVGLILFNLFKKSVGDICATCTCSDIGENTKIINCHQKKLEDNDVLYSDLFTLSYDNQTISKLILSQNDIVFLEENSLNKLKHVKALDLSENLIEEIHYESYKNLVSLEDLKLSKNRLKVFDNIFFNILPSLLKLDLSHNQIESLRWPIGNVTTKLINFDLSHNNIYKLEGNFFMFLELHELDLSFNKIDCVDAHSLSHLRHLTKLYINNNLILSLDSNGLPKSLIELHVGSNNISRFSNYLPMLQVLNIQNNNISELNFDTLIFDQLKCLNISDNILLDIPNVTFRRLITLDVSRNKLPIIPNSLSIENFPLLKNLNVSENPMSEIKLFSKLRLSSFTARNISTFKHIDKHTFEKLEALPDQCITFDICNNEKLTFVDENSFKHLNVCFLDLSNNKITHISPKLVMLNGELKMIDGIDFQGNPFHCNCSLQWMLNQYIPQLYSKKPQLLENLRCAMPALLSNVRMVHWYKWSEQVFCNNNTDLLAKITVETAGVSNRKTIMFDSSTGLLIVIGLSVTVVTILILSGIWLTWERAKRRRRINRRF